MIEKEKIAMLLSLGTIIAYMSLMLSWLCGNHFYFALATFVLSITACYIWYHLWNRKREKEMAKEKEKDEKIRGLLNEISISEERMIFINCKNGHAYNVPLDEVTPEFYDALRYFGVKK